MAIELDGGQHLGNTDAYRRDRRKDALLQENGYLVLRFLAEDVGKYLDQVLDAICGLYHIKRPKSKLSPQGLRLRDLAVNQDNLILRGKQGPGLREGSKVVGGKCRARTDQPFGGEVRLPGTWSPVHTSCCPESKMAIAIPEVV